MRDHLLVLSVALAAGTTQAHADIISYNMTGTIQTANYPNMPYAAGDHITWTLQFDTSTLISSGGTNETVSWANYQMLHTMSITNIVDQTTGYHFPVLPSSEYSSGMTLENSNPTKPPNYEVGNITAGENAVVNNYGPVTNISLNLRTVGPLPTLNLAEFQFNGLPVVLGNLPVSLGNPNEFVPFL